MKTLDELGPHVTPVLARLSRLARLETSEAAALQAAERNTRRSPARRELLAEGEPIREQRAVLSGWACRQRILSDGQRQILSFLLPGDLIGVGRRTAPLASATIVAVTEVTMCAVPAALPQSELAEAYARSAALDEHYLLAQITRLGRMSAYERLADWFLETQERLALVDQQAADRFALPLTQEMLADALGLTSVHVNRMLQALRRDGLLTLQGGTVSFPDRVRLEKSWWTTNPLVSARMRDGSRDVEPCKSVRFGRPPIAGLAQICLSTAGHQDPVMAIHRAVDASQKWPLVHVRVRLKLSRQPTVHFVHFHWTSRVFEMACSRARPSAVARD